MPEKDGNLTPEQEAKKELWLKELSEFIVEANKNTYAAHKGKVPPEKVERKGYKELEYEKGDWRLRDGYAGNFRAPGSTTVYYKEKPAWFMSYTGVGMEPGKYRQTQATFEFLGKALMQITPDLPYRGPKEFKEGNRRYEMSVQGTVEVFKGDEAIYEDGELTFGQHFSGNVFIHKTPEGEPLYPWEL